MYYFPEVLNFNYIVLKLNWFICLLLGVEMKSYDEVALTWGSQLAWRHEYSCHLFRNGTTTQI